MCIVLFCVYCKYMIQDAQFDGYWCDKAYFQGETLKPSTDVWAFGFICYELISKKQPFEPHTDDINFVKKQIIDNNLPQIPNHAPVFLKKVKTRTKHKYKHIFALLFFLSFFNADTQSFFFVCNFLVFVKMKIKNA